VCIGLVTAQLRRRRIPTVSPGPSRWLLRGRQRCFLLAMSCLMRHQLLLERLDPSFLLHAYHVVLPLQKVMRRFAQAHAHAGASVA
jgi:hypothetical protein